jgi:hypothetical protein
MAGIIIAHELDMIYILSPSNNAPDISPGLSLSLFTILLNAPGRNSGVENGLTAR